MNSGLTLILRMRIWALLLLAAIGMQAAEPIRAPLERGTGAAWSAATSDLALVSNRKAGDASLQSQQQPPQPLPQMRVAPLPNLRSVALSTPPQREFDARGPPREEHPARPPDPTAPPLA